MSVPLSVWTGVVMYGRTLLLVAAGFLVGLAVGRITVPAPEAAPAPAASVATVPSVSIPAVSATPLRRPRPGVETEDLAECRRSAAMLAGQLQTYEGVPQVWPAGVEGAFGAAELRSRLAVAWAGKAEVREVDCDEYPCLVELRLTTGDRSCCVQLDEALPPELASREGKSHITGTDDGMYAVMAFGDPSRWSDDIDLRTSWRVDEAGALLGERLADASASPEGSLGR